MAHSFGTPGFVSVQRFPTPGPKEAFHFTRVDAGGPVVTEEPSLDGWHRPMLVNWFV